MWFAIKLFYIWLILAVSGIISVWLGTGALDALTDLLWKDFFLIAVIWLWYKIGLITKDDLS